MDNIDIQFITDVARNAGNSILQYFRKGIKGDIKFDGSPLTLADMASHGIIKAALEKTGLPIVSEEGDDLLIEANKYWIVDPLDGTKEFLADNKEFTINIALIEKNKPIFGLVYAPALDEMYVGIPGKGAWTVREGNKIDCTINPTRNKLRMATSRFHEHSGSEVFASDNNVGNKIALGSALKYGRIALGEVDVYLRLVGTSEWDTAAGQAVLEALDGKMISLDTGLPLTYGKAKRRNGGFIAFRSPYKLTDFKIKPNY